MSDLTTSENETISLLCQQLAALEATVSAMQPPLHQIDTPRSRTLLIPEELKEALPAITGNHFFNEPDTSDNDHVFTEEVVFPKNPDQQYKASAMELPWPQDSGTYQSFDKTLVKIQERLAFTTRPLDEFAVDAFSNIADENIRQSVLDFLQVLRSQLAITARQINRTRMDNFVRAKAFKPVFEKEKGTTIIKDDLSAQVKVAEEFAKACGPNKSSQSNRGQSNRGRYHRGNRGSYFGRYPQQQQQQFQPQYQQHQPAHFSQVQQTPVAYPSSGYGDQYQGQQSGQYFQRGNRGRGRGQAQKQQ
ncbi:hypothetical protein BGZ50_000161 [Haplosporangium sp. Z 11]|nr:hypothetical protein BGZ50_000161 [Haplosporangium sp. Z 11]